MKINLHLFHKISFIFVTQIFFGNIYIYIFRDNNFTRNQEIQRTSKFFLFDDIFTLIESYYFSRIKDIVKLRQYLLDKVGPYVGHHISHDVFLSFLLKLLQIFIEILLFQTNQNRLLKSNCCFCT